MTLLQLIYFQEAAKTSSYTIAATNLYVSQSSISYSIQELERELSVPLFTRSGGKKLVLTNYGRSFLTYVSSALDTLDAGKKELVRLRRFPALEPVKILYSHYTAFWIIQELFPTSDLFQNNGIVLQMVANRQGETYSSSSILDESVDLAFVRFPPHGKIDGFSVAQQEMVLICPSNYPIAQKSSVTLQEIKDLPFFGFSDAVQFPKDIMKMFSYEKCSPNTVASLPVSADWWTLVSHVALGEGIAIVPGPIARDSNAKNISVLHIDNPYHMSNVYLVWRKDRKLPDAVQYVKDYCINYCKEHEILDSFSS